MATGSEPEERSGAGPSLGEAVRRVRATIEDAARRVGRDPAGVRLVAATKTVPVARVLEAVRANVSDFAENYAGELADKAAAVPRATWHFIGKLQRGSAAAVAAHADVVHSGEPGSGLERVARRAAAAGRTPALLVQVDFTGRRQGVHPDALGRFLGELESLAGIRLAGLMTLPPITPDPEGARPFFARLRELRDRLRGEHPSLRELSMGMSADYTVAIEEGATMVRVGTALFGARPARRPA